MTDLSPDDEVGTGLIEGKTFKDFAEAGTKSVYTDTVDEQGFPVYKVDGTLKDVSKMDGFQNLGFAEAVKYVYPVKLTDIKPGDVVKCKGKQETTATGESDWLLGIEDQSATITFTVNEKPYMKLIFTDTTLASGD